MNKYKEICIEYLEKEIDRINDDRVHYRDYCTRLRYAGPLTHCLGVVRRMPDE
jgi:hypothetical protein